MSFEDNEFDASAKSLGSDVEVEWKRVTELSSNPQLFVDGAMLGDIVPGKSGDNYFLGALAALTTRGAITEKLVKAANVAQGSYSFNLWKDGLKEVVTVDDRIPCDPEKQKPLFGSCRQENETWVPLVEKAYAKMLGSYEKLQGGFMDEALADLTGGYANSFAIESMEKDKLWEEIAAACERQAIACTTARKPLTETDALKEQGVLNRRWYFLLGCHESKSAGRMVHIRNPWGETEWTGRFSDGSSDWTDALKSELQYEFGADGTWWMHFDDFVTVFTHVSTCDLYAHDAAENGKYRLYSQAMAWSGDLAGGGLNNHASWMYNPQVGIEATADVDLVIGLSQTDPRFGASGEATGAEYFGIALHGVKVLNSRLALWAAVPPDCTSGEYVAKRDVVMRVSLKAGENLIVVPSTFEPKQERGFVLQVYATEAVRVMTIDSHPEDGRSTPQEWDEVPADQIGAVHSEVHDVEPMTFDHIGSADFSLGGKRRIVNGLDLAALEKEIESKIPSGKLYEDDDFPCTPDSLGTEDEVVWLRCEEIKPDYQLFCDGTGAGDIVQGALGDCWFLGSLATVANRDDLMKQLFLVARPDKGFYVFGFWKNGEWKAVTIDDRIPCSRSTRLPKYGRGNDPREMWVPLLEKAYANLHGTYAQLPGGLMAEALPDLTGGVGDMRNFKRDNMDADAVWEFIQRVLKEGWLAGTSAQSEKRGGGSPGQGHEEDEFGVGILTGHAYSIIDAKDCTQQGAPKLIRLRNPWGQYEWTGPYADNSSEWTDALKKHLQYEFGDDGTFWIPLEEYVKYFTEIMVCRMYLDEKGDVWKQYVAKGAWTADNAGGCMNQRETFLKNPMYSVSNAGGEKVRVVCSLYQNDVRVPGSTAHKQLHPIGLTVYDAEDPKARLDTLKNKKALLKPMFEPLREAVAEFELEPGQHRLLVASTFAPDLTGDFTFLAYAEKPVEVFDLSKDGNAVSVDATA